MAELETGFSTGETGGKSTRSSTSYRTVRWFTPVGDKPFLGLLEWVAVKPYMTLLQIVDERMLSNQDGDAADWRREEAHTLPTHLVTCEGDAWVVIYKCPAFQQREPINLRDMIRTTPKPSADERRTLARIVATQVRSMHVHFHIHHPALRTESFFFMATATSAGGLLAPDDAAPSAPFSQPDITKPYVLDWACGATPASSETSSALSFSQPALPLTVDGIFQHPTYRAALARECPAEQSPWFNQAWALLMILSEIADWRPITGGPFRDEAELREATLQRVRLVTNDSWKNGTTAEIMRFGFVAMEKPLNALYQLSHWQIKGFYDRLYYLLAPVAT